MDSEQRKELEYYPIVEKWMKKRFRCFKTSINRGLRYGRIDVVGIRDVGGDLSGEIETIAIEVKRGSTPFAVASGQTLGYKVYVNRVYLADLRKAGFTQDEIQIASNLGIGLIQIVGKTCKESLSSPYYQPITKLNLNLLENLGFGKCQFCGCFFEIAEEAQRRFSKLTRSSVRKAVENEKGMVFWNSGVASRKNAFDAKRADGDTQYERRFVCPDCISTFFSPFVSD